MMICFESGSLMKNKSDFDPTLLTPHYSTQIYKAYLYNLEKILGLNEAQALIEKCGLNWDYLKNTSNWVSETFAERFYDHICSDPRIDKNFSYESGKIAMSNELIGGAQLLAMQLMDPVLIFNKIPYFAAKLNKVDFVEFSLIQKGHVQIKLTAGRNTKYFDQFIQNWLGYLEQIPALFDNDVAHGEIIESNEKVALIQLKWKPNKLVPRLRKARILSFTLSIFIIPLLLNSTTNKNNFLMVALSLLAVLSFLFSHLWILKFKNKNKRKGKANLNSLLKETEDRYKDLLSKKIELDRKYKESRILSDVLQRINSSDKDIRALVNMTVNEIKNNLKYDRVLYMAYDELTHSLKTQDICGFESKMAKVLSNYQIDLAQETNEHFHLGNLFKNKKSILIPVTSDYFKSLSSEGKSILVFVQSKSFLAVPVYSEQSSFGVLLVDYHLSAKTLTQDDLEFIQCVANQLAISIENIKSFEKEIKVRKAFQKFVPAEVVKSMLGENKLDLEKGISTTGTILFSDLRGFTKNSEVLGPDFLVQAMNLYFREMSKIVYKNGGIIERLMGDGLLAIFNAFNSEESHAKQALATAEEMLQSLSSINNEIEKQVIALGKTWKPFELGIGLNSGPFIVGNIGTDGKTEFTSFGDTVNTTARICEISKQYGNCILYSQACIDYGMTNKGTSLVLQAVRGSSKTIHIYIIQNKNTELPNQEKVAA